jgi:DNA-binding NtrC family response regulator
VSRILIIDDDNEIRRLYGRILIQAGHEVVEAPEGNTGIRLFRAEPCDLVLTDIIMPEKEGLETIREFTRDYPGVRVIAISGGGKATGSSTCLSLAKLMGAHATLSKPVTGVELLEAVRSALED